MRLPKEWVGEAQTFLRDARRHLEEGNYWLTCFEAQQATELYLKALIVAETGVHPFTHDLVELLDTLNDMGYNVPEQLYTLCDALTPHYTLARYPGRKPVTYNRGLGERCLKYAEKIIRWVEEKASETTG